MLIFSRKKNESLVINGNITVTVIEVRGDKVRLGIENPREIPVHRQEVWEAIRRTDVAAPSPNAVPPTPPSPRFPEPPPDQLARLASALQARLAVSVSRELVAGAMREAGIELPAMPTASAPR